MSRLPQANKTLGQHFLSDPSIIARITSDFDNVADSIIEVGPGPGILTKHLATKELPLTVVEKDVRFPEILNEWVENDRIHLTDATNFDFTPLLTDKTWLVSNLPYNVSTVLFINFLKYSSIKYMTLMFQKEVGEKIIAEPEAKKNGNSLYGLANNYFNCSKMAIVKPGAFTPPPKVDSIVISFERIDSPEIPIEDFSQFEQFLRKLYQFKRKQMGKVLKQAFSHSPIDDILLKLNIDRQVRAETLPLTTVIRLFREVYGN